MDNEQKEKQRQSKKDMMLGQLRVQFYYAIEKDYKKDPEKVKTEDTGKIADQILGNMLVKIKNKGIGITKEELVDLLNEIREEVIKANA